MNIFTELDARSSAVRSLLGGHVTAAQLPRVIDGLEDAAVYELLAEATAAAQMLQQITLVASGVISARSTRERGHSGLSQSRGHRTPAALIQHLAGVSRVEAMRQLRVGEALVEEALVEEVFVEGLRVEGARVEGVRVEETDSSAAQPTSGLSVDHVGGESVESSEITWHSCLTAQLSAGRLSAAQFDVVRQGLGDPPVNANYEAWATAAGQLAIEASHLTVEELGKQARSIRDVLDPEGAEARFQERYEARSFTMWRDATGRTHGKFLFDDDSAAWVRTVIDSALRPRRGGPRFIDPAEAAVAAQLVSDERSNEQLAHDLMTDLIKAGAVADSRTVFGARQPGVRIVQIVDRSDYLAAQAAQTESHNGNHVRKPQFITQLADEPVALPSAAAQQQQCNSGRLEVVVDRMGNPLDVGREQRLFTAQQRIALAARDGGCRWNGCDRPASYCEAHHIDHWGADHGRTNIDRGVLLCRFHHMQLHNKGWKIMRDGLGPFILHPPPGTKQPPQELRPRLALQFAWQNVKPPPRQFRRVA